jgi:hypothetical protein
VSPNRWLLMSKQEGKLSATATDMIWLLGHLQRSGRPSHSTAQLMRRPLLPVSSCPPPTQHSGVVRKCHVSGLGGLTEARDATLAIQSFCHCQPGSCATASRLSHRMLASISCLTGPAVKNSLLVIPQNGQSISAPPFRAFQHGACSTQVATVRRRGRGGGNM